MVASPGSIGAARGLGLKQALGGVKEGELRALCVSLKPLFGKPPWKGWITAVEVLESTRGWVKSICSVPGDSRTLWLAGGIKQGWREHPAPAANPSQIQLFDI